MKKQTTPKLTPVAPITAAEIGQLLNSGQAVEIRKLRAENEKLRETLAEFVKSARWADMVLKGEA